MQRGEARLGNIYQLNAWDLMLDTPTFGDKMKTRQDKTRLGPRQLGSPRFPAKVGPDIKGMVEVEVEVEVVVGSIQGPRWDHRQHPADTQHLAQLQPGAQRSGHRSRTWRR